MPEAVLMAGDVERFVREGVLLLKGAFPRELADECRQLLWVATGCDEQDRSTWTKPVIRIEGRGDAPFAAAINTERLHTAFDQLAGRGRWVPRNGIGTFPIRFPVNDAPHDDGWHIGPDDAPTRVRLGSHFDAARMLFGEGKPVGFLRAAKELVPQTEYLPEVAATGEAGDVWLCHPFVVHAGQRHRGMRVKFMAQPPLAGTGPIDPNRLASVRSPVEEAVHRALSV
jgi:hypothetical protein